MGRLTWKVSCVLVGLVLCITIGSPASLAATLALMPPANAVEGFSLYEDERPAMEEMTEALSEFLVADLSDTPGVELVVENQTPEAEEAAKRWSSVADYDGQAAVMEQSAAALDFEALAFSELISQREKPLLKKKVGESAGPEQMILLKQMYNARYYLCPTMIVIGEAENVDALGSSLEVSAFSKSEVKIKVECCLIDGETGSIVWTDTVTGAGKNSGWRGMAGGGSAKGGVSLGNSRLHKGLYTGALESVSRQIAEALGEELSVLEKQ